MTMPFSNPHDLNQAQFDTLKAVALFRGIGQAELSEMMNCLGARRVCLQKDELMITAGEPVEHIGIVLEGQMHIYREDINGTRMMLTALTAGDVFAETFCCAHIEESPVSVIADTESVVLLLHFRRLLLTCSRQCPFHQKLIENMLVVLAVKNLNLQARMELFAQKTIRARLLHYLRTTAKTNPFQIPFNREELADYLCVDRSALSRELGQLKKEGVLDFWKDQFRLLR